MSSLGRMLHKASSAVGSLFRSSTRADPTFNCCWILVSTRKPPGALAAFATEDGAAKLHTKVLNKNMYLKSVERPDNVTKSTRPLIVMMAWMLAKDVHLDKYRKIYMDRGFDVLTVTLSPLQLMFPTIGAQVVARNLVEYLHNGPYREFVLHAFSVGGYHFAEALIYMDSDKGKFSHLWGKFTGVVLDSAVDFYGIPTGFPRALSKSPIVVKLLEWITRAHLFICYRFTTVHYLKAHNRFYNIPLRCPALFLVSRDDVVGNPESNKKVADSWKELGNEVRLKVWDKSGHVCHLLRYPDEYIDEVNRFLTKINAGKLAKSASQ